MRKWNHVCSLLVYGISVVTPGRKRALTAFRRYYLLKNKLRDRMIKQLLNSVIAKYRVLSVSRRSRYFAQPRPIIAKYFLESTKVPFIISHAHHSHVPLFLPYIVLSQSVLLGLRFIPPSTLSGQMADSHQNYWFTCFLLAESSQDHLSRPYVRGWSWFGG